MGDLRISSRFLPPDLSNTGRQKAFDRMFAHDGHPDPVFNLNVTLFGKVGMVVCWYYDRNIEGREDFIDAGRIVRRLPHLLAGCFEKFTDSDLWCLWDALGSFPDKDEDLLAVYQVVDYEYHERQKISRAARED